MPQHSHPILRRRSLALMFVRMTAIILMLIGSIILLNGIGLAVITLEMSYLTAMWGDFNYISTGCSFAVPGLALMIWDRRLVRWMVPLLRNDCPQCGYPLRNLGASRCPECGLDLSEPASEHRGTGG